MDTSNRIIEHLNHPHELERMFRQEPEAFKKAFEAAWEQNPNSHVLAVWNERLNYKETASSAKVSLFQKDFLWMGMLALLAGISTRILMPFVEQGAIAPVNLIFGVLLFITAYFVYKTSPAPKVTVTLGSVFLIMLVYMNMLPLELSDSTLLSYLHLPVVLWVLLGLAFTGNDYPQVSSRLAYLRFNGEFIVFYACMAISGMLLSAVTMQLFSFVGMDIAEFYFENVVLFGAAALAVVAAYLVSRTLKQGRNIAPYIAKIFSPLMLVTLVVYLVSVIWIGKNPFLDRNFLLTFNGILLIVLAVTIFSITESGKDEKKNLSDYINVGLILLALVIDSVALSAIVFRLSSYGITPNRIAVLGVNLLIWVNLAWVLFSYLRFLANKSGPASIQAAVTKYLPIYGIWAAIVTLLFPLIF